ncbi:MAG: hypothetical protein CUN52_09450 [Phototrophicales bacterium]|nr:MAG: hypothetical protein CUN52_09450 [Phototrophicales bacterium]
MTMPSPKSSVVKPSLNTKFHIDYEWWEKSSPDDLRVYLRSHLPQDQQDRINPTAEAHMVDFVDPNTGEVLKMDELRLAIKLAAEAPDFINEHISLVDSVFRVFLKNNNIPLSPKQLAELTGRPAETILKTLSGKRIYQGIRPYLK